MSGKYIVFFPNLQRLDDIASECDERFINPYIDKYSIAVIIPTPKRSLKHFTKIPTV